MRLLTFNTWGMRGDWAARLPVFREGFRALDPEVPGCAFAAASAHSIKDRPSVSDHYGLLVELDPPAA